MRTHTWTNASVWPSVCEVPPRRTIHWWRGYLSIPAAWEPANTVICNSEYCDRLNKIIKLVCVHNKAIHVFLMMIRVDLDTRMHAATLAARHSSAPQSLCVGSCFVDRLQRHVHVLLAATGGTLVGDRRGMRDRQESGPTAADRQNEAEPLSLLAL